MSSLVIKQYEIGPLNNFLYLLGDTTTKSMAIVDPAWDPDFLHDEVNRLGFHLTAIFLTHAHHDHVNGLSRIQELNPTIPTYINKHEAPFLTKKLTNLTPIDKGYDLILGNIHFQVLHTPGHTPGCQCFLADTHLICGDTLFVDGIGRCDLPGGDPKVMYHSLDTIIKKLPHHVTIYPGHNYGPSPTDTIGRQLQTNPYLSCHSMDEFLVERMGF